ncbi:hypothetical protein FT663_03244 [Candidozyma haemuli var. vulneris]|uniref:NAD(+) diphosphatase n=1 Tax=Candidozyma haemuli TaxID=45357 RepID=A0A2V1AYV8_9ASCO|nr:hypothetical protein CXQ85_002719 [[Candida] haemuloni]KAF3987675.1 hypothetical protein FT662_03867 [[Candida] haemuloni var. vulneris]KAF3990301.1 hypothetical protein FT663_03244 [[Candida] haemuloni var. vulneris]PVH22994.1 hypothetical protein CXQ85_002719 [[Candida] haemuloni]
MSASRKSSIPNAEARDVYFGQEVVNRVSFLREDSDFVSNAVTHPSTRFIFYFKGDPLVNKSAPKEKLVVLTNGDNQLLEEQIAGTRKGLLAAEGWKKAVEAWSDDNKEQSPSLRSPGKPTFLLLGMRDESVGLELHQLKCEDADCYLDHQGRYSGIPFFGVDLTNAPEIAELVKDHVANNESSVPKEDLIFSYSRKHTMGFTGVESSLFSHGKMFFDWLGRNRFCPGCGSRVIPIHAGGKLRCTNEATVGEGENKKFVCPVRNTRVSNVSFPRTDAVVITAITNRERSKVLLSLNKRYAYSKMYSCTAGFMEPSETVEVAAKREIWEETGVVCSDIRIQMTQPWPFPGNLMIGCIATVDFNGENETIQLDHDQELADARWFDVAFVKKLIDNIEDEETLSEGIILPTDVSVAFHLIKEVVQNNGSKL